MTLLLARLEAGQRTEEASLNSSQRGLEVGRGQDEGGRGQDEGEGLSMLRINAPRRLQWWEATRQLAPPRPTTT